MPTSRSQPRKILADNIYLHFSHYIIREYQKQDAAGLREIIGDPDLMKEMDHPYTEEETEEFLRQYGLSEHPYIFALEDTDTRKLAGHIIFHSYEEDSFEIGWIIHPFFQGKGLAQACTEQLVKEGERNEIRRFVMECTAENSASRHIIEKCGFQYCGTEEDGLLVYRREI
jgi:RimJ/RimL family protein N-acetyltransferase